jgi:hypothetical protein
VQLKNLDSILLFILVFILISIACATSQSMPTGTPEPTATFTAIPTATNTPRPSPTPRPTWTPDVAATEHAEKLEAEIQSYYEKGYLATSEGQLFELDDFRYEWARLEYYALVPITDSVSDFYMGAHFKWDSALKNSNPAGCGFFFGLQLNNDHYAVFLDRTKVYFFITNRTVGRSLPVAPTRGTGRVKFDYPAEADFTLLVKGISAYVLVNGEIVGEYTLAQSRPSRGEIGLSVLSGTNKDYGTRCEMTDLRLWIPHE